MGRSPLDTAFGSASTQEKRSKKGIAYVALLGVAGLASASSVFAANVTINSGNDISYSQGVEVIAPCDSDGMSVELGAVYVPASDNFALDTVTFTGVASTCDNKSISLQFYDDTAKLVTITGVLDVGTGQPTIGVADTALPAVSSTASTDASFTNVDGTKAIVYESGKSAVNLAADADAIVIEIN
jgi:hypothetical protein